MKPYSQIATNPTARLGCQAASLYTESMALNSSGMLAHAFNIGTGELMVILLVGLLVFGPKRLPEVARKVGKGFQQMRKTANAFRSEVRDVMAVPAEEVGVDEASEEQDSKNAEIASQTSEPSA